MFLVVCSGYYEQPKLSNDVTCCFEISDGSCSNRELRDKTSSRQVDYLHVYTITHENPYFWVIPHLQTGMHCLDVVDSKWCEAAVIDMPPREFSGAGDNRPWDAMGSWWDDHRMIIGWSHWSWGWGDQMVDMSAICHQLEFELINAKSVGWCNRTSPGLFPNLLDLVLPVPRHGTCCIRTIQHDPNQACVPLDPYDWSHGSSQCPVSSSKHRHIWNAKPFCLRCTVIFPKNSHLFLGPIWWNSTCISTHSILMKCMCGCTIVMCLSMNKYPYYVTSDDYSHLPKIIHNKIEPECNTTCNKSVIPPVDSQLLQQPEALDGQDSVTTWWPSRTCAKASQESAGHSRLRRWNENAETLGFKGFYIPWVLPKLGLIWIDTDWIQ